MPSKEIKETLRKCLTRGLPLEPLPLASVCSKRPEVPHAPVRSPNLSAAEFRLALKNALRYIPPSLHEELGREFAQELREEGHIYMRRFRPTEYEMKAYPIDCYPAKSQAGAAMMLMIQNNLDHRVAQFPDELITYGGNGSVLSNWAQYHLLMKYLSELEEDQTLSMYSGHPMGLFPSSEGAPRCVITNGMVIPNYSSRSDYDRLYAMGNSIYGQMTAGSWCYIGPQGIVHGTTLTILGSARKYMGSSDLAGKVYVSSGLGGMSGAQGKAGWICGAVSVIAEINPAALHKRHQQGWITEYTDDVSKCIARIKTARLEAKPVALGFLGNIVTLWEALAVEDEILVELGSDQTSLHNPFNGGYYPVQLTFEEANTMMATNKAKFKELVQESLRRHAAAINILTSRGLKFWDYGNSFLLEASRAGAAVMADDGKLFRYPSYIQAVLGDVFDLGFGPFRWVCLSGDPQDLKTTDDIAATVIRHLRRSAPPRVDAQLADNLKWVEQAGDNHLVVGSQARILYADSDARVQIAVAFNDALEAGKVKGGIVISRDHHDVSGTDSPFRETSNIYDGSSFTADMAVQNFIGDATRGATWVSLHNGGGVGWGEVVNGGFGMLLDGSASAKKKAINMLNWDVNNGVARRAWAGNDNAKFAIGREMKQNPKLKVTPRNETREEVLDSICAYGGSAKRNLDSKRASPEKGPKKQK